MWIHSFCQPTVYEDLRVVSWGNRGFTSSALARVASFRDRHGNPVFHVKPPTTAPSLDALTPASSQDHQDSRHHPVSNRDSPRSPEGKGTTPEFPFTPGPCLDVGRTSELTGVR